MTLKLPNLLTMAVASLSLAGITRADTYTETGDAGQLPATAQVVSGPAGTPLTAIIGSTTLTNGISDGDMYEIFISNPAAFSATTNFFSSGRNNFDDQLFLFTAAGTGVVTSDDNSSGGSQSDVPAGTLSLAGGGGANGTVPPTPPGLYYLLIDGSGSYPVDNGANLLFPNFNDGTTDPTMVYGPNSETAVIAGYTGSSNFGGAYTIDLTGAEFVPEAVVPEPGSAAGILAGVAGLTLVACSRRRAAR